MREKTRLSSRCDNSRVSESSPRKDRIFRWARPAMLANLAFAAFRACVRVFVRARALFRLAIISLIFDVICQNTFSPLKIFSKCLHNINSVIIFAAVNICKHAYYITNYGFLYVSSQAQFHF